PPPARVRHLACAAGEAPGRCAARPDHLATARQQPRHLAHERNARMTATSDRPPSSTSQTAAPAAAAGSEQLTADPTGPIPVLPDDAARLDVEAVSTALKGKWADVRDTARERAARPEMARPENMSVAEHRDRVLGQTRKLHAE